MPTEPLAIDVGDPIAELGMYPFASVQWAWDELWSRIKQRAPWVPAELAHTGDVHARWDDPNCVVNHICGGPLTNAHTADQVVVGAFAIDIPGADRHRYRSTLLSTRPGSLTEIVTSSTRAAVNSTDSLSGWTSLRWATVGAGGEWPGRVLLTGAHTESLRALTEGTADIASIDSWSLALVERDQPELVAGLHRVGHGPVVPTPAITVRSGVDPAAAEQLADAIESLLADQSSTGLRAALLIDGFVRLTLDDYLPILELDAAIA